MANTCPSCGGFLRYDIPSGQLKCDFCNSYYPVETFQTATDAEEHPDSGENYDVTVYTCPSCGAEISSTENTALDYCLYCGSFVTLDRQLARIRKPDKIVPFSRTKDDCKQAYKKMIARKLYAPKEFRSDEFLEGFKGIYIPYWNYSYDVGPEFTLHGETSTRKGDYIYHQHYNVACTGNVHAEGLNYDASSTFDDGISSRIARMDPSRSRLFHPGYMFGFFGDTADVESFTYNKDADETAGPVLWNGTANDARIRQGNVSKPKDADAVATLNAIRSASLTMLPVWFLTWRKNNKLAYSVMNGDTGEIYSEVPVDTKRYLLFSVLTAIPLFFLLNVMFTFTATTLIFMTVVLAMLFISLYATEVERIAKRTLHADDKGYLSRHADEKKRNKDNFKENILTKWTKAALNFFFHDGITGYIVLIVVGFGVLNSFGILLIPVFILAALAAPFYSLYRIHKNSKLIGEPHLMRDIYSSIFVLIASISVAIWHPANDMFYYGVAILCLLAIGFTTVRIMIRYNEVITRPLPHFFDREEGDQA